MEEDRRRDWMFWSMHAAWMVFSWGSVEQDGGTGGQTIVSFALYDVHALVLGNEEVEWLFWIFDGADLVVFVNEVPSAADQVRTR